MGDGTERDGGEKQAQRRWRGINFYTLIRRVHLYTALILVTFIVMYFVTGIAIVHRGWFGEDAPVEEEVRTVELGEELDASDPGFEAELAARLDLPGRRSEARGLGEGRWRVEFYRPGLFHRVDIEADGTARIVRRAQGFRQTLVGFHRVHGYGGGWFFSLWALMMDLVNVSLIVFGLSGIYMWWKLSKRHALGWVFLAASYGYAIAMVVYLMYGR